MQVKTNGIVISHIKYSETSIICKIYTQHYGTQSFIINSVRSKKSKNKIALFQPLTHLEFVMFYKENRDLQRISEVKCVNPLVSIPTNFVKSCVAIFISEVMSKVANDQNDDAAFFNFLCTTIQELEDADKKTTSWIPLLFMVGLCRVQGFLPFTHDELKTQMTEDIYVKSAKLTEQEEKIVQQLVLHGVATEATSEQRKRIFQYILAYYRQTIGDFRELKSLQVLKELTQ